MRIVLMPNVFLPLPGGGVITWTDYLAKYFSEAGHHVIVIVHRPHSDLKPYEVRNGFEIYRIKLSAKDFLGRVLIFPQALARIFLLLRQIKPDIVHVQFLHINMLYPLLFSYVMPYKLILRACGNDIHKFAVESGLFKFMIQWGFRHAHQIQFNSKGLQQNAKFLLEKISTPVVIVGDGASTEEFSEVEPHVLRNQHPYIFAMGRLVHKKGFDLLIESFAEVVKKYPNLQLVIGGNGEEMLILREMIRLFELEKNASLPGYLDRTQVGAYLKGCRLFVLPSRSEPVGIVTIEAMSVGKPVLVTRVGGVPDIVVHGQSGWLVEPTSEALTEGMYHLLQNPELMNELGRQGLQRMRSLFSWRKIADDCLMAYAQVISE